MNPRRENIKLKRIYESPSSDDGIRILIDRLWPRGISKEKAKIDHWLKEISPSTELRKWFHQTGRWQEFRKKYIAELNGNEEAVDQLKGFVNSGTVTLLYSVRDEQNNHAIVIKEYIEKEVRK